MDKSKSDLSRLLPFEISMSQPLTDEQAAVVRTWADAGADLPVIQKRLGDEFEVHLTFMDTRFLIADLGIELKAEEEEEQEIVEPAAEEVVTGPEPEAGAGAGVPADQTQPLAADDAVADEPFASGPEAEPAAQADPAAEPMEQVAVTISELQRPGMMANGRVTFANGQDAEWYLDQMGQLGMNPADPKFRPSPRQMLAFQQELQRVAQQKGMT